MTENETDTPDGIAVEHVEARAGLRRHASPLSLLVFATVVILGLSGLLGRERTWRAEANGTELEVHASEIIRNGEFFEMRLRVVGSEPIDELRIEVDASLWEDMTVNTMIPAATEEGSADGVFAFTFAEVPAGEAFDMKADLQVNPDILGSNPGTVRVLDGDEQLVELPIEIRVLP